MIFVAAHFMLQCVAFFMELEDNVDTLTYKIGNGVLHIIGFPVVTIMYFGGIDHINDNTPMWHYSLSLFNAHFLLCFFVNSCFWAVGAVIMKRQITHKRCQPTPEV